MDKYAASRIHPNAGDEASALNRLASSGAVTKMLRKTAEKIKDVLPGIDPSNNEVATNDALDALKNANNVVIFAGAGNLDSAAARNLVQAAANVLISTDHIGRPNNGLIVVWPSANGQGAHDMGFSSNYEPGYSAVQHLGSDYAGILSGVESGSIKVLYVAGADLVFHDAAAEAALRSSKSTIIVTDTYMSATAELADVVLPVQTTAETEGTFTNGERRVQRFYPAIERAGESQPDWLIAQQIGAALDMGTPAVSSAAVMAEIAKTVPGYKGITYQRLAQHVDQYPDVGGDDLYYGGTAFQNRYGVGLQVPSGAEEEAAKLAMKSGDLAAMDAVKADGDGGMILMPINLIYDREPVFEMGAPILHLRIPAPHVGLNPADAQRMSIAAGDLLEVTFNGHTVEAAAHVDIRIPQGVATMPRDLQAQGAPLTTTTARIVKSERVGA